MWSMLTPHFHWFSFSTSSHSIPLPHLPSPLLRLLVNFNWQLITSHFIRRLRIDVSSTSWLDVDAALTTRLVPGSVVCIEITYIKWLKDRLVPLGAAVKESAAARRGCKRVLCMQFVRCWGLNWSVSGNKAVEWLSYSSQQLLAETNVARQLIGIDWIL